MVIVLGLSLALVVGGLSVSWWFSPVCVSIFVCDLMYVIDRCNLLDNGVRISRGDRCVGMFIPHLGHVTIVQGEVRTARVIRSTVSDRWDVLAISYDDGRYVEVDQSYVGSALDVLVSEMQSIGVDVEAVPHPHGRPKVF